MHEIAVPNNRAKLITDDERRALAQFYRLLDKWDREARNNGDGNAN